MPIVDELHGKKQQYIGKVYFSTLKMKALRGDVYYSTLCSASPLTWAV
jgi:hypothetical protein